MNRKHFIPLAAAAVVLWVTQVALSQTGIGKVTFGSYQQGTFDSVNLYNLNVHFGIPVVVKAGREF